MWYILGLSIKCYLKGFCHYDVFLGNMHKTLWVHAQLAPSPINTLVWSFSTLRYLHLQHLRRNNHLASEKFSSSCVMCNVFIIWCCHFLFVSDHLFVTSLAFFRGYILTNILRSVLYINSFCQETLLNGLHNEWMLSLPL